MRMCINKSGKDKVSFCIDLCIRFDSNVFCKDRRDLSVFDRNIGLINFFRRNDLSIFD